MGSLRWVLSWLMVVAVGLAPILVYWVAGRIGPGLPEQARGAEDGRPASRK